METPFHIYNYLQDNEGVYFYTCTFSMYEISRIHSIAEVGLKMAKWPEVTSNNFLIVTSRIFKTPLKIMNINEKDSRWQWYRMGVVCNRLILVKTNDECVAKTHDILEALQEKKYVFKQQTTSDVALA